MLIIKANKNSYDDCYKTLKVPPKTHEAVKKVADETNRQLSDVATTLVEYALANLRIEEE